MMKWRSSLGSCNVNFACGVLSGNVIHGEIHDGSSSSKSIEQVPCSHQQSQYHCSEDVTISDRVSASTYSKCINIFHMDQ